MDLTPHARRIVELARAQRTPSEQDLERIEARIALGLGMTAATASVAAESAKVGLGGKAAAVFSASKWIAGAGLLVAAAASYAAWPQPATVHAPAPRAAEPARPAASVQEPAALPALPGQEAEPPQVDPAPVAAQRPAHAAEPRSRANPGSDAAEVELLHQAQAAWRARDASKALSLLREHRVRFARSSLGLERDALQVLTLCALGRKDEAARLARGLFARAPRSPLRASIEESCALE